MQERICFDGKDENKKKKKKERKKHERIQRMYELTNGYEWIMDLRKKKKNMGKKHQQTTTMLPRKL